MVSETTSRWFIKHHLFIKTLTTSSDVTETIQNDILIFEEESDRKWVSYKNLNTYTSKEIKYSKQEN